MSSTTQLDANQVIKLMYDDNLKGMTHVPAHAASAILLNAVPGGTTVTSTAVWVLPFKVMGVMINWAGLDAVDGTVKFQGSIDGTLFVDIGSATTLSSASGAQDFGLIDEPYCYIQVVYTHGTNTVGTVTVKYMLRA
jgi:hypothetical protein